MKRLLLLALLLALAVPCFAKSFWAKDDKFPNWTAMENDIGKQTEYKWFIHPAGSACLYDFFRYNRKLPRPQSALITFGLGVGYETWEGLVQNKGKWGGNGFSYNDLIRNTTGIGSAWVWNWVWDKRVTSKKAIKHWPGYHPTKRR